MIQVIILDLGPSSHHEGTDEDDAVLAVGLMLFVAEDPEDLVANSAVEDVATIGNSALKLRFVLIRFIVSLDIWGTTHVCLMNHLGKMQVLVVTIAKCAVDLQSDVEVPIALEKAHSPATHVGRGRAQLEEL